MRVYDPQDSIYLFGFSRGAFTVRTLADLIAKCGILDWDKMDTAGDLKAAVNKAYRKYRRSYRTMLGGLAQKGLEAMRLRMSDAEAMTEFKMQYSLPCETPIAFVGVWDTVDAVGTPFHISDVINMTIHRFKFPDLVLGPHVKSAAHAISIDDARQTFHPLLWESDDRIEQVWFSGVHSNVGGGYPKQGISLVTLDWMMHKAEARGLRILGDDRQSYRERTNVDDKLYDSRAGLAVFYRWLPRDMSAMCEKSNLSPKIHLSALERIAYGTEGYAPGNLAAKPQVVVTPTGDASKDAVARARAARVEKVFHEAHADGQPLLSQVRGTIAMGRVSYYLYVLTCVATILAASVPEGAGSRLNPWVLLKSAGSLIYKAATGNYEAVLSAAKRLLADPLLLGGLLGGLLLSGLMAWYVDHRMSKVFSGFWHKTRHELRKALLETPEGEPKSVGKATGE